MNFMYFRYNMKFSASVPPSEVDKAEIDREADMESVESQSQEDDEENEEFVEAVEDMADLNASQRKELMEILRKVEKSEEQTEPSTREGSQPNDEGPNGDAISS